MKILLVLLVISIFTLSWRIERLENSINNVKELFNKNKEK
jgi:hypothetical protein